jgi:hypothetical protein
VNYIERRKTGGHSDIKPFYADQKKKTMEKYNKRWKAIIAYLWRTHRLKAYTAAANEAETKKKGMRKKRKTG